MRLKPIIITIIKAKMTNLLILRSKLYEYYFRTATETNIKAVILFASRHFAKKNYVLSKSH